MTVLRTPSWGLSIGNASCYGWRWCIQLGPFCIFAWFFDKSSEVVP